MQFETEKEAGEKHLQERISHFTDYQQ